jgi:hypothetical protein
LVRQRENIAALVTVVVAGLVGTGCSASATDASQLSSRSPAPAARSTVASLPATLSALQPGRYTFRAFHPRVTFSVTAGWEVGHRHHDMFDIWQGDFVGLAFARPTYVIGRHGHVRTAGLGPDGFLSELANNPGVTHPVRVGRVTVGNRSGPALDFRTLDGYAIFGVSDGAFHPGSAHLRVVAMKTAGAIIVVMETSVVPPHHQHMLTIRHVEQTVQFSQ